MFYPPDPDNYIEMRLVIGVLGAGARAGIEGLILTVFGLIVFAIAFLAWEIIAYLFRVYWNGIRTPSPYRSGFCVLLAIGVGVLVVGYPMTRDPQSHEAGVALLTWGFATFGIFSALLDFDARHAAQVDMAELEDVTYDDVIRWQREVNAAQKAELAPKE